MKWIPRRNTPPRIVSASRASRGHSPNGPGRGGAQLLCRPAVLVFGAAAVGAAGAGLPAVVGGVLVGIAVSPLQAAPPEIVAERPESTDGYTVRPVWTLGGPEADDPAQFYERIGQITFDADAAGNVYVLDNGNHRVQVFASDGRFLRSYGQEGKGPGEFNLPRAIAVNARGEAAIFDVGNQRISVFTPEGRLLRDQLVSGAVAELELTDEGLVVCSISNRYELVGYGPDGEVAFEYGASTVAMTREVNIETDFQSVASRLQELPDGALVLGGRGPYDITRFEGAEPRLRWSRPFERQKMEMPALRDPGEDGEAGSQVVMIVRRDGGGAGEEVGGGSGQTQSWTSGDENAETLEFDMNDIQKMMPEHVPDLRGLLVWPDARVWAVTAADDGDRMVVDEWSSDGRYVRRFPLPRYSWLAVGEDGALYGLTHDDEDYPLVQRLEVVAG